jgi:hypothetical protein
VGLNWEHGERLGQEIFVVWRDIGPTFQPKPSLEILDRPVASGERIFAQGQAQRLAQHCRKRRSVNGAQTGQSS